MLVMTVGLPSVVLQGPELPVSSQFMKPLESHQMLKISTIPGNCVSKSCCQTSWELKLSDISAGLSLYGHNEAKGRNLHTSFESIADTSYGAQIHESRGAASAIGCVNHVLSEHSRSSDVHTCVRDHLSVLHIQAPNLLQCAVCEGWELSHDCEHLFGVHF